MRFHLVLVLSTTLVVSIATAATINVPADQPTIQAGINAASNGDNVLVAAGTYTENINFLGKAIIVSSSAGAKTTIIDGGKLAPVVTFSTSEGAGSVLRGFTLQNGTSTFNSSYSGGGIYINSASPTMRKRRQPKRQHFTGPPVCEYDPEQLSAPVRLPRHQHARQLSSGLAQKGFGGKNQNRWRHRGHGSIRVSVTCAPGGAVLPGSTSAASQCPEPRQRQPDHYHY